MQKIGIIGAMDMEVALIKDALEGVQQAEVAQSTYYIGRLGGHQVVLTCCGIGKVNAAISAQVLCSVYGVDCIINTGIAGNLAADLKLGDVVLAQKVLYHDFDPDIFAQCPPHQKVLLPDSGLCDRIAAGLTALGANFRRGVVATGDEFVQSSQRKADIIARTGADCAEMEGAAIGHVAARNGVPFAVVRCLSDDADDAAESTYENFAAHTAQLGARLLIDVIRGL